MTNFFKKISRGAKKFFGKVKNGLSDTFKKGGYLTKGLDYAGKGLNYAGKAINFVDKIPVLGAAVSPLTNVLKSGLSIGNKLVDGVRTAQNTGLALYDQAKRGQNVDNNLIGGLKQGYQGLQGLGKDAKAIDFKGAGQQTKANMLEKAKEIKSNDPPPVQYA